jgi:hypothetical protein
MPQSTSYLEAEPEFSLVDVAEETRRVSGRRAMPQRQQLLFRLKVLLGRN